MAFRSTLGSAPSPAAAAPEPVGGRIDVWRRNEGKSPGSSFWYGGGGGTQLSASLSWGCSARPSALRYTICPLVVAEGWSRRLLAAAVAARRSVVPERGLACAYGASSAGAGAPQLARRDRLSSCHGRSRPKSQSRRSRLSLPSRHSGHWCPQLPSRPLRLPRPRRWHL